MSEKSAIRKAILESRNRLSAGEAEEKSRLIISRLMMLDEYTKSTVVMCYMSFGNEVQTGALVECILSEGKRVAIPLVVGIPGGKREMMACEIRDTASELEPGTYGILEPRKDSAVILNPLEIDLVVVPGVAFDINRNRIGYGAGFFDRFLKSTGSSCKKIALAYEMQVLEQIPAEEHDIPVDMIITEERIIV